jgi:penicillin amidase
MLGIRPGRWTPAVVVSRFNGLLGRVDQELMLALAIRAMGVEQVKDVMYFQPSDPKLELDPAIDASLLTKEILATFRAFRTPLRFTPDELLPAYRSRAAAARLDREVPFDPRTSGKASAATIGWSAESLQPADIR